MCARNNRCHTHGVVEIIRVALCSTRRHLQSLDDLGEFMRMVLEFFIFKYG